MTVYVDKYVTRVPKKWKGGGHLMADSHEELVAFAKRIRLNPNWMQHHGRPLEHYDLTAYMREVAILNGAVEVTTREMMALVKERMT
jgi:hypothetical protein